MQLDTLISLVKQLTSGITIPFVGEPLEGLQVMGALETRGLEFENIIISSLMKAFIRKKVSPIALFLIISKRLWLTNLRTSGCHYFL
jgi:inactivated superfamily I helicase